MISPPAKGALMTDSHECGSVSTELASAPTQFAPSPPPALDGVADAGPERAGFAVNRPYAMPSDLLAEKFGPLFYADFGGAKRLYACSLELVDELCDESRFAKNPMEPLARARPLVGDGLFTAFRGEPNWQKAHDVLLPGFSYSGLRNYHTAMLEINDRLVAHWDDAVGARPVDVGVDLQKLAMDTVGLAGFGARFDSFTVIEGFAEIPTSFLTASSHLPPDGDEVIFNAERARLYGFIDELIADHQRGRTGDVDDLLNLMLAAGPDGKPALGGQAIRNQVLTFLIAGQLTTSELMPMAVYNLLHHPAVLHRAQADVDTVFGPEDNYAPTYEDIGKLTFLRQVIDETLRLSPPASSFDRMALADTVIGGRYPIKQGEAVSVLVGALHRQPQWGDNVELFDPDRFTPEHTASRPASLFKPFGTGARSCIGRQFALHEATLTLSRLLHRYRMLDSGHYTLRYESTSRRRPVGFLLDLTAAAPTQLPRTPRPRAPRRRPRPRSTPVLWSRRAPRWQCCTGRIWAPAGRWPNMSPTTPPPPGASPQSGPSIPPRVGCPRRTWY
ncbi:cytochrome P450 [Mycolicibacterium sp. CBMA 361]|uniref:cytochrome P450 n=1 Tax=Mycolicibacterium sp. CBMA 361 TaxID=2606610 RepID=UPI001EF0F679|nr:cytochrome P450 [Mycolicibacterium sp. CBMA 361]